MPIQDPGYASCAPHGGRPVGRQGTVGVMPIRTLPAIVAAGTLLLSAPAPAVAAPAAKKHHRHHHKKQPVYFVSSNKRVGPPITSDG